MRTVNGKRNVPVKVADAGSENPGNTDRRLELGAGQNVDRCVTASVRDLHSTLETCRT
jgi:hypothetical protein